MLKGGKKVGEEGVCVGGGGEEGEKVKCTWSMVSARAAETPVSLELLVRRCKTKHTCEGVLRPLRGPQAGGFGRRLSGGGPRLSHLQHSRMKQQWQPEGS